MATSAVGRFAPSPTGPLHMGSLVTALASYIDAKAQGGRWLVRMENLDPPREMPGAEKMLLEGLLVHGLEWDGEVLYQNQRRDIYRASMEACYRAKKLFFCTCSRQDLESFNGVYPGTCRGVTKPPKNVKYAVRLKVDGELPEAFDDLFQGTIKQDLISEVGDFVVKRKDDFIAYQFAVVVDDALQGVNRIIRGVDLIDSTAQQIYLQSLLRFPQPIYGHVPVVMNDEGQKLSKRAHAPPLDNTSSERNLFDALCLLQQKPPADLKYGSNSEILEWAAGHWRPWRLEGKREVLASAISPPSIL